MEDVGYMDSARAAFAGLADSQKKKMVRVVAPRSGISGQLMENQLPSFWSEPLSQVFSDLPVELQFAEGQAGVSGYGTAKGGTALARKGQKTPTTEMRERAKRMHAAGHSYGDIAKSLGKSRSYAFKLVKDSGV